MSYRTAISAEYLRQYFSYNPETGEFIRDGRACGCARPDGYRHISIDGRIYMAHRMAWLYVHGEHAPAQIDHINGDRADNRIANLRLATAAQNLQNRGNRKSNKSGRKGVYWNKQKQQWHAQIQVDKRRIHLGLFDDIEAAHEAYKRAAERHHGEFRNFG